MQLFKLPSTDYSKNRSSASSVASSVIEDHKERAVVCPEVSSGLTTTPQLIFTLHFRSVRMTVVAKNPPHHFRPM